MNPIRARIEYALVSALAFLFRLAPLGIARSLADLVGWIAGNLIRFRRTAALDNLRHAFPEAGEDKLRGIYRSCWRHLVRVGAELTYLPRLRRDRLGPFLEIQGDMVIQNALQKGIGAILVAGHFGNWEWMGGCASLIGYQMTYVATNQSNPLVDEWLDRTRKSAGVEIIRRRDAARGVLSALKRNRMVAMLCDQDAGKAGVFVPFFGRPASTPRGPALFHIKTGVPLIYGSARFVEDGRYRICFEELNFNGLTGERESDEAAIMAQITARLEADVRRSPEQWLWLHRRWKTRPT